MHLTFAEISHTLLDLTSRVSLSLVGILFNLSATGWRSRLNLSLSGWFSSLRGDRWHLAQRKVGCQLATKQLRNATGSTSPRARKSHSSSPATHTNMDLRLLTRLRLKIAVYIEPPPSSSARRPDVILHPGVLWPQHTADLPPLFACLKEPSIAQRSTSHSCCQRSSLNCSQEEKKQNQTTRAPSNLRAMCSHGERPLNATGRH